MNFIPLPSVCGCDSVTSFWRNIDTLAKKIKHLWQFFRGFFQYLSKVWAYFGKKYAIGQTVTIVENGQIPIIK